MLPGSLKHSELGPYVLIEQVAVGGMAEIYLAKTRGVAGFEKMLCLKVIHPNYADDDDFIQMLIDEAKIAVGLNHVNIAQIFDLGHDAKTYYIAMEFIDGADLFKIMRSLSERDIEVAVDTAVYIGQEVCTGLDYAHRKRDDDGNPLGIIHRDISPQNILISTAGEVKIIDFGIAKAASRSRKTQAGVIKGKYYYMSPEQAWGDPMDARSDIFSAGIIVYEVLTGQMLYLEEDIQKLLDMVRKADIPRPSTRRAGIPPELENIVMKALAKRPADRWQTAHEFQVALTSFLYSFSPDFTPERVAEMLQASMGEDVVTSAGPDLGASPEQREDDNIMSRGDFRPESGHSVIFNVEDYLPSRGEDQVDEVDPLEQEGDDERTMVSAPPEMLEMLRGGQRTPDGRLVLDLGTDEIEAGEYDENAPTRLTENPGNRPQDLDLGAEGSPFQPPSGQSPGSGSGSSPVQEVVVTPGFQPPPRDRARASHDVALTPRLERTPSSEVDRPDITGPLPQLDDAADVPTRLEPPGARATQSAVWSSSAGTTEPEAAAAPTGPPADAAAQSGGDWSWPPEPGSDDSAPEAKADPSDEPAPAAWPQKTPATPSQPNIAQAPSPPPQQPRTKEQWTTSSHLQGLQAAWPGGTVEQRPLGGNLAPDLDLEGVEELDTDSGSRRIRVILVVALTTLALAGLAVLVAYWASRPVAPTHGMAKIVSQPPGASITLDDKAVSKVTPATLKIADLKRKHTVELTLPSYQAWTQEFSFQEGDSLIAVVATLQPIKGKLTIRTAPAGAEVLINGDSRGKTPLTVENLDITTELKLELRKAGHATTARTIVWEGKEAMELDLTLEKAR